MIVQRIPIYLIIRLMEAASTVIIAIINRKKRKA